MPTYPVTVPDGSVIEIDASNPEEAGHKAKEQYEAPSWKGSGKAAAAGVAQGVGALLGAPRDLYDLGAAGVNKLTPLEPGGVKKWGDKLFGLGGEEATKQLAEPFGGMYEPHNTLEKGISTATSLLPTAAIGGPEIGAAKAGAGLLKQGLTKATGVLKKGAANVAAPAAAITGGGEVAKNTLGPKYEKPAEIGAALLTGRLGVPKAKPGTFSANMADKAQSGLGSLKTYVPAAGALGASTLAQMMGGGSEDQVLALLKGIEAGTLGAGASHVMLNSILKNPTRGAVSTMARTTPVFYQNQNRPNNPDNK